LNFVPIEQNPKFEYRNPKQARSTKNGSEPQTLTFGISDFEFVSDFEIRISDL